MKAFLLLPTGIADVPVEALGGRTPLEAARTPALDRVAGEGRLGEVRFVPSGLPNTSAVSLLSVLGYDPRRWRVGRGAVEAVGMGVSLGPDDLALRLNLVTTSDGRLEDFRAGSIGRVEARLLVESLQTELGSEAVSFHPGMGYRNLLVLRGAGDWQLDTVPPQEVQGLALSEHLPYGRHAEGLVQIMRDCAAVLADHDVNRVRLDLGENPANGVWPWGAGRGAVLEPFPLRTERELAVVGAVPLALGLGRLAGGRAFTVPGGTGDVDTDHAAKLRRALSALEDADVVLLHIAAANEACHAADVRRKVLVIEELDRLVVAPLLTALRQRGDTRLLITSDHMTSAVARAGATETVPFALWGPGLEGDQPRPFSEAAAAAAGRRIEHGHDLLEFLLEGAHPREAAARAASDGPQTKEPAG